MGNNSSNEPTSPADLLHHPALWRAGELGARPATVPSGHEALDRHLPGNGWPQAGLCELMLQTAGVGELRLLLPALRTLSRQMRWIAWVNPPFIPYAPALEAAGVDIGKILLIHPKSHQDALWALERASRSGTCSAALAWLDEQRLAVKDTRRLQLAARQGGTFTCLFRPEQARALNSMAELRLHLRPADGAEAGPQALSVTVCKRRGGWPVDFEVPLGGNRRLPEIREQLSLWRRLRSAQPAAAGEAPVPVPPLQPLPGDAGRHVTH